MNYDLSLVASVLESRDLSVPLKLGFKAKMLGQEAQTYWDIIMDRYNRFHEVPDVTFFKGMVPSYVHVPPTNNIESIIDEVRTRYLHEEVNEALKRIAEANNINPWVAKAEMLRIAEGLSLELFQGNTDLIAGEDKREVLNQLHLLQRSGGLLGLAWPWEYLNNNSMGLMPGNFIYIYGREKSRKTFLLLYLALFWESCGLRVLFNSREMSREEIAWRLYPMRAGLSYPDMTKGHVSTDGMYTLEMAMDSLYEQKNIIVSEAGGGIAGLRAKIEEIQPDVVILDYMKAIADDEMGDKFNTKQDAYVARTADLVKKIAQNPKKKIPIVACGHANREGIKLKGQGTEEIGHSDHIVRRADMAIRVIVDDVAGRMGLIINAGRNVQKFLSWTIDARLDANFGTFMTSDTSWIDDMESVNVAARKTKEAADAAGVSSEDIKSKIGKLAAKNGMRRT